MRWLKTLRLAIAAFVVIFAAIVAVSFRRGATKGADPAPVKKLGEQVLSESGTGVNETIDKGKTARSIRFGHIVSYADGRQKLTEGVTAVIPDKNGRRITIESREADVLVPPGKTISTGEFTGGV